MAFGRSNSLSINTGATNSLFGQQNSQPQQSSLFGTANNQSSQPSSLFGGANAQTPQTGSLFGGQNSTAAQPQTTSLFGNTANAAQPATTQTSLFGNANTANQASTPQSNLFGGTTQNTAQPSLFGNTSGNLFNKSVTTTNATQPATSSLFGGNSLFGKPATQTTGSSLLGGMGSQNTQPQSSSIFGLNAVPRDQLGRSSLLGVSQFHQAQSAPFAGRLTMGQSNAPSANTNAVGAVRVSLDDMRSTTRFQDLIDPLKEEFERADKMIQAQENFCRQIEALKLTHGDNVQSLTPDVALISEKADAIEQLLSSDAQAVYNNAGVAEKDRKDFERCRRIAENLAFPAAYHLPNSSSLSYGGLGGSQQRLTQPAMSESTEDTYDVDLVGNYFVPMIKDLKSAIDTYSSNLLEIEAHMKVIEGSAIGQAQQLAARRAGVTGQMSDEDTIRDLADTLRGFEHSILGVAGAVGQCREGVTELVLGRLTEHLPSREPWHQRQ